MTIQPHSPPAVLSLMPLSLQGDDGPDVRGGSGDILLVHATETDRKGMCSWAVGSPILAGPCGGLPLASAHPQGPLCLVSPVNSRCRTFLMDSVTRPSPLALPPSALCPGDPSKLLLRKLPSLSLRTSPRTLLGI